MDGYGDVVDVLDGTQEKELDSMQINTLFTYPQTTEQRERETEKKDTVLFVILYSVWCIFFIICNM